MIKKIWCAFCRNSEDFSSLPGKSTTNKYVKISNYIVIMNDIKYTMHGKLFIDILCFLETSTDVLKSNKHIVPKPSKHLLYFTVASIHVKRD